jgi:hypothetical protein
MACYALPRQHVTFYDIDPVVRRISFDSDEFFTFVRDAKKLGAQVDLHMGDARLTMQREEPAEDDKYGLLVVDAFSSDAIPVHLITWEALEMYWKHMRPDGIVCFHVSNRYLDLRPVLANFAKHGGLTAYVMEDDDEAEWGKARSTWVVLARKPEHLARLDSLPRWERLLGVTDWEKKQELMVRAGLMAGRITPRWRPAEPDPRVGLWTDDYSNLWSVFNKNR